METVDSIRQARFIAAARFNTVPPLQYNLKQEEKKTLIHTSSVKFISWTCQDFLRKLIAHSNVDSSIISFDGKRYYTVFLNTIINIYANIALKYKILRRF